MLTPKQQLKAKYTTQNTPNWCPGCGNFGIWVALKNAIANSKVDPHNVVLVGDIGCSGKMIYWTDYYGFAGLHGRAIPIAEGIKMANKNLTVIVVIGDGGALNEGLQHFIHASRRNADINVIMHNNQVYGLTKGQTSATSEKGYKSSTTPVGSFEQPLNPIMIALTAKASFVASGFSGNTPHLTQMIQAAIEHRGFSFVDAYQPCVTFNYINTFKYFSDKTYVLDKTDYKADNVRSAFEKAWEIEEGQKLPIGIIYRDERRTLEDELLLGDVPLTQELIHDIDVTKLLG